MAYWVYKCDASGRVGRDSGDWDCVFSEESKTWGSIDRLPELGELRPKDLLLAYQSDRNELVGLVRVTRRVRTGKSIHIGVQPLERIGAKVRPLKKRYSRVDSIPALRQGWVRTLYPITPSAAKYLLSKARLAVRGSKKDRRIEPTTQPDEDQVEEYLRKTQGFEKDPKIRRALELAAETLARMYYQRLGYQVTKHGKPFDLLCRKRRNTLYVEVKGTRSKGAKIWLTPNEVRFARSNPMELFIVHSMKLRTSVKRQPAAYGGTEKIIASWRPTNAELQAMMYSYTVR